MSEMSRQLILTQQELNAILDRIMEEARVQATYNNQPFLGLAEQDIIDKLIERIGVNWKVV